MFHRFFIIPLSVIFLLPSSLVYGQDSIEFLNDSTEYLWPTDATKYLSSTFGETRSAHLHSGIDIRTWGQEGYKVYASRNGTVHRIGIGPHGYGNVIYLRHDDDTYTVYAHLNRFETDLQAYADSIRLQDYRFELDHFPNDDRFVFQQGDVIGYTGSTGVGPPHLHFEIRDSNFNPINPLLSNLADDVDDSLPPVFTQLGIEFLSEQNYSFTGYEIFPARGSNGHYDFGKITVNGPVGLSVNVHDKANRAPNSYAVHSLMMVQDGDTLFHSVKDQFSFYHSNDMFLDRSYPILARTRQGFQRLFRVSGNRLPIYQSLKNEGVIHWKQGEYTIQIVAEDIYGNQSVASLTLNIENSDDGGDIQYVATYPLPSQDLNFEPHNWVSSQIVAEESLIASAGPDISTSIFREKQFLYTTHTSSEKQLIPGEVDLLHTADQKLWIQFPSEALYDSLTVRMNVQQTSNQIDIEFSPVKLPINRSARFNYILPENFRHKETLGLYSVDPYRNRERFIRADISNGMVRASLNEITNLRLKEDSIAPWVGRPAITQNLGGMHIVRIPVKDEDSGIDFRKSKITVNGEKGIVEYDPEKNFLIFYHPRFLPLPANTVAYEVFDGVGNRRAGEVTVPYN
ncbi:M23 family metallopeptidase [Rhodohalobacter halophilus]|uniref:M23 family metallopeptidase n=1 Tax=Rhodohalobacter halophilus TaxID=1812810 RepID=UPI00083FBF62|nr:M23 family metallopeptidase [Rhodohalobacter halophilus]